MIDQHHGHLSNCHRRASIRQAFRKLLIVAGEITKALKVEMSLLIPDFASYSKNPKSSGIPGWLTLVPLNMDVFWDLTNRGQLTISISLLETNIVETILAAWVTTSTETSAITDVDGHICKIIPRV